MYLARVQIKNFRNLEDVDVTLGEKVVLLGENGVGKSNFIEALRILLDSSYRPLLGENDFTRGDGKKPFGENKIEIHAWFSGIDEEADKDLLAVIHDCHVTDENTYQISAEYRPIKNRTSENATTEDDFELVRYGGGRPDNQEGARRFRQYVRLVTIPAVRDLERDMQSWRTSPLRRLVEMINLRTEKTFENVAQSVRNASGQLQNIPPVQDLQNDIRALFGTLVEGQSLNPTIGIAASNPEDLLRLLTILVEQELPIERTSLGISNILYLMTWLVYSKRLRKISRKSAQKPEYIILAIEEPESHLHPHFQRLVFENIFKQEHLLLISTHSPTIVSVTDPRHFLVLKRTEQGIKGFSTARLLPTDTISTDTISKEVNKKMREDISRFLDATRGEVVFSRGVLLIEGDAEMFLIPAFAKAMKEAGKIPHTLDGAGISVCNVYGTDFRPYIEFFGPSGLKLPLVVLTDGDPTAKNNGEENTDEGFAGLRRGKNLAERLIPDSFSKIKEDYDNKNWDSLRVAFEQIGIFVNESTLEAELIKSGYQEEFCSVYEELGASRLQLQRFKAAIERNNIYEVIKRIETVGMGKGRFAQRLASYLDANRVPLYIEKAIRHLVEKIPRPVPVSQFPPVSDQNNEPDLNEPPF